LDELTLTGVENQPLFKKIPSSWNLLNSMFVLALDWGRVNLKEDTFIAPLLKGAILASQVLYWLNLLSARLKKII